MQEKTAKKSDYVLSDICQTRHKLTNWVLGIIFILMVLFISVVGISLASSNGAIDKVDIIKKDLNSIEMDLATHLARQEEVEIKVISTLGELKESVDKNTEQLHKQMTEQRVLMEKILHNHP